MEAKGEAGTMAMHGRRPRKVLQNRAELLTYETVREALHVATRLAQSDEHGQFVIRMSQCVWVLSDAGRHVLERIARCGCGFRRKSATHSDLKSAADSDLKPATCSDPTRPPIPI